MSRPAIDGDVESPAHEGVLEVRGALDLLRTLRLHRFGPLDPTMVIRRGELWRAVRLPEGPATLHVRRLDPTMVRVRTWGPGAEALFAAAPELLGLHDAPERFAPGDPIVEKLLTAQRGVRVPRMPDPLLFVVKTILEQRVRWKDAASAFRGLLSKFGEPAPGPSPPGVERGLRVLPPPRTLGKIPLYELAALGVEQRRARVVLAVCRSHRRIQELRDMPIPDAEARLRAFPGVGPWTAGMVCGYALGHVDAAPTGDLDLPHVVSWALTREPRGSDERMLELLEPFRPHRWRVIRALMEGDHFPPRTGPRGRLGPSPGQKR